MVALRDVNLCISYQKYIPYALYKYAIFREKK